MCRKHRYQRNQRRSLSKCQWDIRRPPFLSPAQKLGVWGQGGGYDWRGVCLDADAMAWPMVSVSDHRDIPRGKR